MSQPRSGHRATPRRSIRNRGLDPASTQIRNGTQRGLLVITSPDQKLTDVDPALLSCVPRGHAVKAIAG